MTTEHADYEAALTQRAEGDDNAAASSRRGTSVGVRDVARTAGVSAQTVSRVINGHPSIREATRIRVLDAISELNYRPNNAARALGTSSSRTLGLLASETKLFGPSAGIAALEAAARAAGRWVTTAYTDASDESSLISGARHLEAQGVDALIVVAPHKNTIATIMAAGIRLPVIALHSSDGADRQREGEALAVDHLVALGHRRLASLSGPADWLETAARDEGVDQAVEIAGLVRAHRWRGDWSAASGAALAAEIAAAVRSDSGPTAIVVANDQMALGLIAGLGESGLRVPHDVSVAGFDDNPDAAFYSPALTSVRLDLAGEASRAVALALGLEPSPPSAPVLVARASTAPPA